MLARTKRLTVTGFKLIFIVFSFYILSAGWRTTFYILPVLAQSDTTPPVTDFSIDPETPDGLNDWYVTSPSVTLDATDLESGVKEINWKINSGTWQKESFSNTLNLAPNPSFEDPGSPVALWDVGDSGAAYSQDIGIAKFENHSLKIISTASGWYSIRNEINFSASSYLDNMSASIWVKAQNANQTYFEVYALYDDGGGTQKLKIAQSDILNGTFDWILLPLAFTVSKQNTFGVFIEAGINGSGTVWFDGVSITSSVNPTTAIFSVSDQGEDSIEYYSVDFSGNEEIPHTLENFKVDTRAPTNFKNFTKTQAGNDHTFIISADVDDSASGLDVSTAEFQYFIEGKEGTWGYYEDFLNCSSFWVEGGWIAVSVSPEIDGSKTAILTTPPIDFCSSNWQDLKKIRFRISDMAGNIGTSPGLVVNGPWVQVNGGDVYANSGIGMGSESQASYLIRSGFSINNFTSKESWYISYDRENSQKQDYTTWKTNFPPSGELPGGELPRLGGRYEVTSSFTLDGDSLNDFDSQENLVVVVFVDGDLNIDVEYELKNTSALFFIVSGDVIVDSSRKLIEGFFVLDGSFISSEDASELVVKGGVLADSFQLERSLSGNKNETDPAEIFNYDPKYLVLGSGLLGVLGSLKWREVTYRTPVGQPGGLTCQESGGACCTVNQTGVGQEFSPVTDCEGLCFSSCDNFPYSSVSVWLKWNNFVIFAMSASDDEDPDYTLSCVLGYGDGSQEPLDCRFGFWVHIFPCPAKQQCVYTTTWTVTDTVGGQTPSSSGVVIDKYPWRF